MPRKYGQPSARLIYPQIIQSQQIRELAKNKDHLLLFYCLFHGVDDQGRMEARVSSIQTHCLSHLPENAIKPRTVQEALVRMREITDENSIPLIYIYPADGTMVLQIAKWWVFQNGMRHAWPSRWSAMPGWVDDIRGHGKAALAKILADESGDIGDPNGDPVGGHPSYRKQKQKHTDSYESGDNQPWALFAVYLDELGIQKEDFPGYRIQLAHAKKMLADGFTPDEVRAACKAFAADPYWSTTGFDLAVIRAHWGKLKSKGRAKPVSRPIKTIDDIEEPPAPSHGR